MTYFQTAAVAFTVVMLFGALVISALLAMWKLAARSDRRKADREQAARVLDELHERIQS